MKDNKIKHFLVFWLPVILWAGVIFYASSQPYQKQDLKPALSQYINVKAIAPYIDHIKFNYAGEEVSVEKLGAASFIEFFIRKGAHFTVYFILAFLFYRAFRKGNDQPSKRALMFTLIFTILYAISDEFHQSITPNRSPHLEDVTLDSFGVLIGTFLSSWIYRTK
jgi:VanZ family protein